MIAASKSTNSSCDRVAWQLSCCGLLTLTLMVVQATVVSASDLRPAGLRGTLGYDSQIWYTQYHPEVDGDQVAADQSKPSANGQRSSWTSSAQGPMMLSSGGSRTFDDTSLAQMFVDNQNVVSPVERIGVTLSDWERTRIAGSGAASTHIPGSGGPSATTILVGFVSAIVVCGAIFSRNELASVPS